MLERRRDPKEWRLRLRGTGVLYGLGSAASSSLLKTGCICFDVAALLLAVADDAGVPTNSAYRGTVIAVQGRGRAQRPVAGVAVLARRLQEQSRAAPTRLDASSVRALASGAARPRASAVVHGQVRVRYRAWYVIRLSKTVEAVR